MDAKARFIQIDEEGYLLSGETRLNDEDFGRQVLENIFITEGFTTKTSLNGETFYIEAFDEPLVAHQVHFLQEKIYIQTPYQSRFEVNLEGFCLDEWDRFHGLTTKGVPFVFTRKAQADFFNHLDEYDDESITLFQKKIEVPSYFPDRPDVNPEKYWSQIYQTEENPGWNLNAPSTALVDMLPRLKMPKSSVLIPGCGEGHDAAYFAEQGHIVTAVDISSEALNRAKKKYGHFSNITWLEADVFKLPREWDQRFDLIYEYTCFCAVNPSRRNELIKTYKRLLHSQGQLMALFFVMPKRSGPPFGGSEWELRKRLESHFQFLFWGRWKKSIDRRLGKELYFLGQKKSMN